MYHNRIQHLFGPESSLVTTIPESEESVMQELKVIEQELITQEKILENIGLKLELWKQQQKLKAQTNVTNLYKILFLIISISFFIKTMF